MKLKTLIYSSLVRLILLILLISGCNTSKYSDIKNDTVQLINPDQINVQGELNTRLMKNFDRLEEGKYQPDSLFISEEESNWWPGDKEGRTILALTKLAQATGREPKYLDTIIKLFPEKVNEKGYFYLWKIDANVLASINRIIERVGNWILSTDIGCDFIFMDGVVQAYQVSQQEELKPLIDEMIGLFRKIDLVQIKAQTHASLTGLRALLRYYQTTGDNSMIQTAEKNFNLYLKYARTENYENYNWFGRPEGT